MTHTQQLLDKARDLCLPPTDYRLAQILDIDPSTIYRCRNRGGTLDNKAVHALAHFLQQDFESVLALIELDREKKPDRRAYWEKVAPRVVPSLVIGILATAGFGFPRMSAASHYDTQRAGIVFDGVYIMRSVRRWLRRLAESLSRASYRACHA